MNTPQCSPVLSARGVCSLLAFVVALGAATVASAQFVGSYALTPPTAGNYTNGSTYWNNASSVTFGTWTASGSGTSTFSSMWQVVTSSGASLRLYATPYNASTDSVLTFTTTAQGSGTVSFSYQFEEYHAGTFSYITGGSEVLVASANAGYPLPVSLSFSVNAGDTFGFKVAGLSVLPDLNSADVLLSNFAAPIPEPATCALWAGAAGLVIAAAVRRRRRTA